MWEFGGQLQLVNGAIRVTASLRLFCPLSSRRCDMASTTAGQHGAMGGGYDSLCDFSRSERHADTH
jgi:hypothetical protein